MKAAVFHGPNQDMTIEQVDIDSPLEREVLVRTAASGVCHSDLHFVDGLYPLRAPAVLGHEAAGVVEEVGAHVTYVKPGDHIIMCLSVFCGQCERCLQGRPNLCLKQPLRTKQQQPRLSQNGKPLTQMASVASYAEYMITHENGVLKIDDDFPLDVAALIGCGVTTGLGAAINTAKVEPGSTVAVFGAGGVGLSAIQGASIAGARMVIAVDMNEFKLGTALNLGATHIIDASSGDPVEAIRDLTEGQGVDYAFEAIGLAKVAEQCFDAIRFGGTATVIGMIPPGEKVELPGSMFLREKRIQGSMMGSNRFRVDMPKYMEWYRQGRLKLDEMITKRMRLEDVNEAMRAMRDREVTRSVLMFD